MGVAKLQAFSVTAIWWWVSDAATLAVSMALRLMTSKRLRLVALCSTLGLCRIEVGEKDPVKAFVFVQLAS